MTHLCAAIFVTDVLAAKRDIALAAEAGADMVELRLDEFEGDVTQLLAQSTLPAIITFRPQSEGGRSHVSDDQRLALLSSVSHLASYTDLELATFSGSTAQPEQFGRLILSAHDFRGRPDKLTNLLIELNESPAHVVKIVWTARSIRDNLEVFEILQHRAKPTIALCMGDAGMISRVLAKKFGGFLTFASLDKHQSTAPGQLTVRQMKRLYRWDDIRPTTRVYGVVGHPVAHSLSPAIHNAAFDHISYDGIYLPLLVNSGYESFKAFMESFLTFAALDLSGLSITIPHKENALRYLQEKNAQVDELAVRVGAINTIVIDRSGGEVKLRGYNTDCPAILQSITGQLQAHPARLGGVRAAVIGAGGTARAAVAALTQCGATVVVYNRTLERARALAAEFDGRSGKVVAAPLKKLCDSCCQIYINTTSIGMHPNINASPFGDRIPSLGQDTLVLDVVYNPLKTKLLAQAEAAGAKTVGGIEVFLRQAAAQFQLWTEQAAPIDLMRDICEEQLQPAA